MWCAPPPPFLHMLFRHSLVHDAGHAADGSTASSFWAGSALFPSAAARCAEWSLPSSLLCTSCLFLAALPPFPTSHSSLPSIAVCCAVYGLPGAPYECLAYYPGYGQDYGQGQLWLLKLVSLVPVTIVLPHRLLLSPAESCHQWGQTPDYKPGCCLTLLMMLACRLSAAIPRSAVPGPRPHVPAWVPAWGGLL